MARDSREERRTYEGDVVYEVWRSGGNVDHINDDRVSESYWDGLSAEQAAYREIARREPQPSFEEQYLNNSFPESEQEP